MGKFMEYRLEESSFNTKDFTKHEYFHDVLEHIVDTNSIELGEKTDQTITKRIEDVSEFQKMLDDYKNVSQQKFDSVAKKFGFSWTKICKGPYSGRTAGTDEEFKNVNTINKFIEDHAEEYALKIPVYSGDGTIVYMTHAEKQSGTLEKYKTSFEKKHGVEVVAIRPTKKGFNKTIRSQKIRQYDFVVAGDESTLKELFAKYLLAKTFEELPQSMQREFEKNLVDSENEFGSLL